MTKSSNAVYEAALTDFVCNHIKHDVDSRFIESVLIKSNGYDGFYCVGFQKVDDQCFIIIGRRNAMTRYTATSATDAIEGLGDWYAVTREEGNRIYKYILSNKQIGKNGKEYFRWEMDE